MSTPTAEDIRRKLEGRLEVVEAAREPYSSLVQVLRSPGWKLELRGHLELLREVEAQEPTVQESLARIRRRAEVEGWPAQSPALAPVYELESLRKQLERLVHRHLGRESPADQALPLAERLPRLKQRIPAPLTSDEVVLLKGGLELRWKWMLLLPLMLPLFCCFGIWAPSLSPLLPAALGLWLVAGPLLAFNQHVRSGRYLLTQKRLLWEPSGGEPVEVPLQAIRPRSTRLHRLIANPLEQDSVSLHWQRGRLRLGHVSNARQLARLLWLHTNPDFPITLHTRRPSELLHVRNVVRRNGGVTAVELGTLIIRPGRATLLPTQQILKVLEALGLPKPKQSIPFDLLIEQLRWLPESELGSRIEHAALLLGGEVWKEALVTLREGRLLLHRQEQEWEAWIALEQLEPLRRMLQHWPPAS